jgi:hypothetical protein
VTEQQEKRKPGRPSKGKRGNFTFRVTDKLRSELIARAEGSGLSVSEEIERMLDQSINGAGVVAEVLGGPHNSALLLTIASAIATVESVSGKKWTEDHHTYLAMITAVRDVIDQLKMPPDVTDLASDSQFGALTRLGNAYALGESAAKMAVSRTKARRSKKPEGSKS